MKVMRAHPGPSRQNIERILHLSWNTGAEIGLWLRGRFHNEFVRGCVLFIDELDVVELACINSGDPYEFESRQEVRGFVHIAELRLRRAHGRHLQTTSTQPIGSFKSRIPVGDREYIDKRDIMAVHLMSDNIG